DDIAYLYLDLLERLKLGPCPVIGFSLGGWIALQMAIKDDSRFSKLILVDPYGVKIGGPTDRDIQDIWTLHPDKVVRLKWADPDKGKRDFTIMSEEDLGIVARNIESFARFCWDPYMHDPKLKHRLHRVEVPTLFVWGEKDGIITPDYGRAFSKLIKGAEFVIIADAGHYPQIEQPQAFLRQVRSFLA
ncbi:MAG TPA: alpha/beta hydrolase, partial [Beijerinckiaceae bacterium]|nr:alpha/beta hydrolase [Beijerinckiaceae bacterium]